MSLVIPSYDVPWVWQCDSCHYREEIPLERMPQAGVNFGLPLGWTTDPDDDGRHTIHHCVDCSTRRVAVGG